MTSLKMKTATFLFPGLTVVNGKGTLDTHEIIETSGMKNNDVWVLGICWQFIFKDKILFCMSKLEFNNILKYVKMQNGDLYLVYNP